MAARIYRDNRELFWIPPLCFSVLELKHAIQAKYKIAIQHQVLVVNGGECMAAERRVCSYSAGTVSLDKLFLYF